jgi:hypothetical protein
MNAKNGIGYAVHAHILPAGWTQIGQTRTTHADALIDLAGKDDGIEELAVHEVLAKRGAA